MSGWPSRKNGLKPWTTCLPIAVKLRPTACSDTTKAAFKACKDGVKADYWLAPWPGTESMLLLAFAHVLLHENLFDPLSLVICCAQPKSNVIAFRKNRKLRTANGVFSPSRSSRILTISSTRRVRSSVDNNLKDGSLRTMF